MDIPSSTFFFIQTSSAEYWLFLAAMTALASGGFLGMFRFLRRIRLIEDTPTAKIRSAPQGYVELTGISRLMQGDLIIAPLTGKQCTWYSYKIEERSDSPSLRGGRQKGWRIIEAKTSDELFLLADDTGECVIDPEGATVTPTESEVWFGKSLDGGYRQGSRHSRWAGWFSAGQYRYTEKRIHPGDPLYAIGQFHTTGGSQELLNTREEVARLLQEWKRNKSRLLQRFDTNADGEIDLEEWELARAAAHQEVLQAQVERSVAPGINMMSLPEHAGYYYVISGVSQDKMVKILRYYILASLLAFFGGGGMVVWMLSIEFTL